MAKISVSRKALYDLVWNRSLKGAAAELGISDVGLRKVCDNNDIPRPPPGYLQMKEPKRTRAYKALKDPENDKEIKFEAVTAKKLLIAERSKQLAFDLTIDPEIRDRVYQFEKQISEKGSVDERGMLNPYLKADRHLIRVSRSKLRQASDLLISCLSAISRRGYSVEFKEDSPRNSYYRRQELKDFWVEIRNNKSTLKVWVEEFSHRATRSLTTAERAERVKSMPWYREGYKPTLVPNGKLYLCYGWGERVRVDLGIDAALVDLEERLEREENRRIEAEKFEREREQKKQKEIRNKLKTRYRELRQEAVLQEAKSWSDSNLIRAYVAALSEANPARFGLDPQYVKKWIAFANSYADRLDPISSGQAMKKQKKPSVEHYGTYYEITTESDDPIDDEIADLYDD